MLSVFKLLDFLLQQRLNCFLNILGGVFQIQFERFNLFFCILRAQGESAQIHVAYFFDKILHFLKVILDALERCRDWAQRSLHNALQQLLKFRLKQLDLLI